MRLLTIGFASISIGFLVGGILNWFTGLGLQTSVVVRSAFTTIGFGFLMYSLFVDEATIRAPRGRRGE